LYDIAKSLKIYNFLEYSQKNKKWETIIAIGSILLKNALNINILSFYAKNKCQRCKRFTKKELFNLISG